MADEKKKTPSEKLVQKVEMDAIVPAKKSLAQIANKINSKKKYNGKVELASKKEAIVRIPTGILALDYILKGGFPRGRINLLAGGESSWKSTICLRTIAEVQKLGGRAAYFDVERTFDPVWAGAHGVDLDQLLVLEPETAEEAYNQMTEIILSDVDVVVLDSLNTLSVKKEMFADDKGMEAAGNETEAMGVAQRKISQWIRNNTGRIAKSKTCMLVISQLRDNINAGMYGNPNVVVGGRAIKFAASVTLATRQLLGKTNEVRDEESGEIVGKSYECKIEKNKTGRADITAQFTAYGEFLDNMDTMLNVGVKEGIIQKPNNKTYVINGVTYNGKGKAKTALCDKDIYNSCYNELIKHMGTTLYKYNPYEKQAALEAAAAIPINENDDGEIIPDESLENLLDD
jgi:recombination protein RecA